MLAGAKVGERGLGTGAGGPRGTTGATTAPTVVQAQEDQEVTTGGTATTTEADTEEAEEASAILETAGSQQGRIQQPALAQQTWRHPCKRCRGFGGGRGGGR